MREHQYWASLCSRQGDMSASYKCCLCGGRNAQEGQWQHWFVNPEFSITIPPSNLPETHWIDNECCYINGEDYTDPVTGLPKIRVLIWFYICHRCLEDLPRFLHPSSIVTLAPPSPNTSEEAVEDLLAHGFTPRRTVL